MVNRENNDNCAISGEQSEDTAKKLFKIIKYN